MMWTAIYNAQNGVLNALLTFVGLGHLTNNWLGNMDTAFAAVIFQQVFYIGYFMIVILASRLSIPDSYYEAAELDGANILQQEIQSQDKLKFSKHASMRLDVRQIELSDDQMTRLEAGVNKAEAKGIKESLVLMDNVALVVNIENKTVVTALDQSEAREHVFTNIDGAVLI